MAENGYGTECGRQARGGMGDTHTQRQPQLHTASPSIRLSCCRRAVLCRCGNYKLQCFNLSPISSVRGVAGPVGATCCTAADTATVLYF